MPNADAGRNLRERLTDKTEDRLGKAITDLFDNPLVSGALGRASDARERAAQAQELAMGVLNLPSAADVERLTRRLRAVSQRLEGIEDGVHRLGRALASEPLEARLGSIEEQLRALSGKLDSLAKPKAAAKQAAKRTTAKRGASAKPAAKRPAAKRASKPAR